MRHSRCGRLLLTLAVTVGLLVLTPSPSWACSCAIGRTPEQLEAAGTVASGTVEWTATDGQRRTYQVRFDAVYKGVAGRTEKLRTSESEAACGVADLAPEQRYLFFIDGVHGGTMRIGLCGGTVAYDAALAARIESRSGPPGHPVAGSAPPAGAEGAPPTRRGGSGVAVARRG